MGWKQERKEIQRLMDEVNDAPESSQRFNAANSALNQKLAEQPPGRRFNILYRK